MEQNAFLVNIANVVVVDFEGFDVVKEVRGGLPQGERYAYKLVCKRTTFEQQSPRWSHGVT